MQQRLLTGIVVATALGLLPAVVAQGQQRTGRDFPLGLEIDLDYSYYDVHGSTPQELHETMRANGPQLNGDSFFALTAVETGFRFRHLEERDLCRLTDIGVQARVVMRLPRWSGSAGAITGLDDAWDDFLRQLMSHEAEHYRLIENGTRRIYNALLDLHAESCDVLEAEADRTIRDISDTQAWENEQLDRNTSHGASTGAVWPPTDFVVMP